MNNTVKLCPCPFCGGEAKLNYFGDESHIPFYQVSCIECGCKQSNSIHKESVINAWNTRKPMDSILKQLKELCNRTYYKSVNGNRDEGIRNNAYHNAIDIVKAGVVK